MDDNELVDFIKYFLVVQDEFPEELLRDMMTEKEQSSIFFLTILENVLIQPEEVPEMIVGHIYALYALAEFRDSRAYPAVLQLLSLPHDIFFTINARCIQDLPAIIASVFDGNKAPLMAISNDPKCSLTARDCAKKALLLLDSTTNLIDNAVDLLASRFSRIDLEDTTGHIIYTKEQQAFWGSTLDEITFYNGKLPVEALQRLLQYPKEASELMLYVLKWSIEMYPDIPDDCIIPIYALYILAQLREKEAYPLFISLFAITSNDDTNPLSNNIFSVSILDGAALLASVYDGNSAALYELIEDEDVSAFSRIAAYRSLCVLYHHRKIDRESLVEFLKKAIELFEKNENTFSLAHLAIDIVRSGLSELYDRIRVSFSKNVIDAETITQAAFEDEIVHGLPNVSKYHSDNYRLIDDAIDEAAYWHWLAQNPPSESAPEPGRHDPCF